MTIRHYTSTPCIAVVVAFSVNVLAVVVGFKSLNNATAAAFAQEPHLAVASVVGGAVVGIASLADFEALAPIANDFADMARDYSLERADALSCGKGHSAGINVLAADADAAVRTENLVENGKCGGGNGHPSNGIHNTTFQQI